MRFALILTVALVAYWLSLSGYFTPMILSFGVISILVVLGLCYRMKILDEETVPYLNLVKTVPYFFWLSVEIIKANMAVVRAVLSPNMEVSPTLVRIKAKKGTDIGRTMFANSITLTPGTVSMEMGEDEILVHALLEEMSAPEGFEEMSVRAGRAVNDRGAG